MTRPCAPEPSERLAFRPWTPDDAATVLDLYGREEVYRYLGSAPAPCRDLAEARERIARWAARAHGPFGLWAVVPGAGPDRPVGTALLLPLPPSRHPDGADAPRDAVEIGWHFHPGAWGRGYATEAGRALLARAAAAGLGRVHAVVYPDNTRSAAVCRRLGMTGPVRTRRWYDVELDEYTRG